MKLVKKIYTKKCEILNVEEIPLNKYESNNLKGVLCLRIGNNRFLIKRINNYIFEYAAVLMNKVGREYKVLYNSNSIAFLKTCIITKHAVELMSRKR